MVAVVHSKQAQIVKYIIASIRGHIRRPKHIVYFIQKAITFVWFPLLCVAYECSIESLDKGETKMKPSGSCSVGLGPMVVTSSFSNVLSCSQDTILQFILQQ